MTITYILACVWYRLSDYILYTYVPPFEPEERYWVVKFGLRAPCDEHHFTEEKPALERLNITMYYMLTTLSTIGFGDMHPYSISEKVVGAIIEIAGVTLFTVVMNSVVDMIRGQVSQKDTKEEDMVQWLKMCNNIKIEKNNG
jgi:hypothetical protein